MSSRELVILGTSSLAPTRYRAHNGYALRWDDQLIIFDPGEGTQRQCTLAGVAIARATAVCVTHFHGDHSLGLPGVIQRRALDNGASPKGLPVLPVFFPADGQEYFDRMRAVSIFHDTSNIEPRPVAAPGVAGSLGTLTLRTAALKHRTTTFGYRVDEPDGHSLDADRLAALGIAGPDVGRLVRAGSLNVGGRTVLLDEVSVPRKGQSMAFIMDTLPCEGALELADGADLVVCESTYLHAEHELAASYKHMTARQAGQLAAEAGARRLVLTHFSARYADTEMFGHEAAAFHHDVVVASDLATIEVPGRQKAQP